MGAVTAAVIGAGTALYTSNRARSAQRDQQNFAREQMENLDPFAEYRPEYAERLRALTADPSSIKDTATYKARLMAAERTMASQGYTGSGNALVAAADAGASAYQQEFENLGMLSGAIQGQSTRASAYGTAAGAMGNASDNYLSSLQGLGNSIVGIGGMFGNRNTGGNATAFGTGTVSGGTYGAGGFNAPVIVGTGGP